MGRIIKAVLGLGILAALGTLGYAYFGDMQADPVEIRAPVTLPGIAPPPAPDAGVPAAALAPPATAPVAAPAPAPAAPQAPAATAEPTAETTSGAPLDD